ncbi:MAG: LPS export ABC transporter ATP-binding protein [Planctomycetes bacterium]|nr:LPS export ABC transporter ATP-binding protein [Planctomycetota bacterium]
MLQASHLKKVYGKRTVVHDVSLCVNAGEIVGILGPNGAGKTTTFYMIMGLVQANQGQILFDGVDIGNYPMHKRAQLGLGYLPQETSLFKKLTVADNILMVWELTQSPPNPDAVLDDLLTQMSIQHLKHAYCIELSGGEKRRVEIARLLASKPKIVLLDEPFAGIDPIAVGEIKSIITQLKALGLGVIITDHNVRETLSITDKTYILHDGRVLLNGSSAEIIHDPDAKRYYLGDSFDL